MSNHVKSALSTLLDDLVKRFATTYDSLPFTSYQEGWDSPCIVKVDQSEKRVYWRPQPQQDNHPLPEVEQGLEIALHPDLLTYYGSFWSEGIRVESPWGEIGLIQVWNPEDLEMLKENLLGHAFVRAKRKMPTTFFLGVQRGDRIITIDNDRGVIVREQAGKRQDEVISNSLAEFLQELTPNLEPYDRFE